MSKHKLSFDLAVAALAFAAATLLYCVFYSSVADDNLDKTSATRLNSGYCQNVTSESAIAHIMLLPSVHQEPDGVRLSLNLQSQVSTTKPWKNVDFTENGIVVCQTGSYLIYGSVNYKPDKLPAANSFLSTYSVRRTKPNGQSEILFTDNKFAMRAFYLEAGDVIAMLVSGQGMLEFGEGKTYVGLVASPQNAAQG